MKLIFDFFDENKSTAFVCSHPKKTTSMLVPLQNNWFWRRLIKDIARIIQIKASPIRKLKTLSKKTEHLQGL